MAKIQLGLNQGVAWALAIFAAGGTLGAVYGLSKFAAKHSDDDGAEHANPHGTHEEHESASHGDEHKSSEEHPKGESHESSAQGSDTGHGDSEHKNDSHDKPTDAAHSKPAKDEHGKSEHDSKGHDKPAKEEHDSGSGHGSKTEHHESSISNSESGAWAYEERNGPKRWAQLSESFQLCESGKKQSPIDVRKAGKGRLLQGLEFHYGEAEFQLINTDGRSLGVNGFRNMTLGIDGERYTLQRLDMHQPAEHHLLGSVYDFEIQLIHAGPKGKLAIVSLLFEGDGELNAALKPLTDEAPAPGKRSSPRRLDFSALLPKKRTYFHYPGSLTIPPCSENVDWYVMATPGQMSSAQLDWVARVLKANSRPLQNLNGRSVSFSQRS